MDEVVKFDPLGTNRRIDAPITKWMPVASGPPPVLSFILQEDGVSFILQEDGTSKIAQG